MLEKSRGSTLTTRTRDPEATRDRLLHCAFTEVYEHGYAGASLERILADSGVTKGALYHHFDSKADLVHGVVDEVIRPWMLGRWVAPLAGADDPVTALLTSFSDMMSCLSEREMMCGCPLNNLTQELSATDDAFREQLAALYDDWRAGLAKAFAHGQERGTVRTDLDATAIAAFVIASFGGLTTAAKTHRDPDLIRSVVSVFTGFLESLRAAGAEAPAA